MTYLTTNTLKAFALGLLFIVCLHTEALAQEPPATAPMLPLSITILYFDQSSYLLRSGVKTTLDSLARLLISQPALMATIRGYTDPIGQPELNLILARNRAKAVVSHLKQRGVPPGQMVASWEKPELKHRPDDQTIGRRVVVQLSPAQGR